MLLFSESGWRLICEKRKLPSKCTADPTLLEVMESILPREAKDEALAILFDGWDEVVGDYGPNKGAFTMRIGLMSVASNARDLFLKPQPEPMGPKALAVELEGLQVAMLEVAGRLKDLSPTALRWIGELPLAGVTEGVTDEFCLWLRSNAGEAFPVQEYSKWPDGEIWPNAPVPESSELAERLAEMAEILRILARDARAKLRHSPGIKQIFDPPPVDLEIFDGCATILRQNGKSLTHLRPIAEAIFRWATQRDPKPNWGAREQKEATRKQTPH